MQAALDLARMSIEDKLIIMESLWENLCRNAAAIPSPSWHGNILEQRESVVAENTEKFLDWDSEKEKIRQSLK